MADGEVMQLENSNDVELSQEKYFEIIFGKTAVLFSAACESGALVNNRPEPEVSALREFGKNLGIIFQIIDDLLDYSSQEKILGKEIGNDFFEGKVTLPIILTYENAFESERNLIRNIFEKNLFGAEKNQNDFTEVLSLIEKRKGLDLAKAIISRYHSSALKNLEIFSDSVFKQNLIAILNYSSERIL
jgi:octaprenyl-diphosphate synthase